MSIQTIECKYCDTQVSYTPCTNFILFCPKCRRQIYLECEYGYGPVTPCSVFLGEETLGNITANEKNKYLLQIKSDGKTIKLKEKYLNALKEAGRIMKSVISPETKSTNDNLLKIKIKGGSLCFYGDWFGRPGDNFHQIKQYSYEDDILEIIFDKWEHLIIFEPTGITNTENQLNIHHAKKVKWSWYPYGSSNTEMNKISYELIDGKVHKISKSGEEVLERKEPYFAVSLG